MNDFIGVGDDSSMARKVKITQEIKNVLGSLTSVSNRERIEPPVGLISELEEYDIIMKSFLCYEQNTLTIPGTREMDYVLSFITNKKLRSRAFNMSLTISTTKVRRTQSGSRAQPV